jgi:hypothetical protein
MKLSPLETLPSIHSSDSAASNIRSVAGSPGPSKSITPTSSHPSTSIIPSVDGALDLSPSFPSVGGLPYPSTPIPPSVDCGGPQGGNAKRKWSGATWAPPPSVLSPDQLSEARWLGLSAVPASPGAVALVTEVAALVVHHEATSGTRQTTRRQSGLDKLRSAVSAIVGGLLRRWGRDNPEPVFRSRTPGDFSGGLVGARQFLAACEALVELGLVRQSRSIRYGSGIVWDGSGEYFHGKAPRLWPAQALLDAAGRHGVVPASLADGFKDIYPTKPPAVPKPLQMFALKTSPRAERAPIPVHAGDPEAVRLKDVVDHYNTWIAEHDIGGCLPPRLKRVFTATWALGGRWYAVGNEGNYQMMRERERLARITIGGETVAEVDVQASHLSIMHGLLGLPLPEGDLYRFPDVPRWVAKVWITATLGKGSPVARWAPAATKGNPDLADHDPKQVGRIICERYPFLRCPADAVATPAGLDKLDDIGPRTKLLTHRLMAIEAQALTGAMGYLEHWGVLALPMHDGLIIPVSGVRHVGNALLGAFSWAANRVRIRWTIDGAVGG